MFRVGVPAVLLTAGVASAVPAQEGWATGAPLVTVGGGIDEDWFHGVASVFLRDSVVYVADGGFQRGSQQVRGIHLRSGDVLHVGGRFGEGPGEFDYLGWADDCGSDRHVFTYDGRRLRISVFSGALEHLRTYSVDAAGRTDDDGLPLIAMPLLAMSVDCTDSETLVMVYMAFDDHVGEGPHRPNMRLGRHSLEDGSFLGFFGDPFPGDERYRHVGDETQSDGPRQWGKRTILAVLPGGGYVLGTGDGAWLTRHGANGALLDTLRLGMAPAPIPIGASEIRRLHERELGAARARGADLASIRRGQRRYQYPESYPPYSRMFLGADGNLWIQAYPTPQWPDTHRWWVLTNQGGLVATLEVPRTFDLHWADGELAAGVMRDELDVEHVEVREIVSSADPRHE